MTLSQTVVAGLPALVVSGEFVRGKAAHVEDAVSEVLSRPGAHDCLVVDLSHCSFMDGAGLEVLFVALEILPPSGLLGVIAPGRHFRRLIKLVGIESDPRFHVFDSPMAAASFLAERRLAVASGRLMPKRDAVA